MHSRVEPYNGRLVGWPIYGGLLSDVGVIVDGYPSCRPAVGTALTVLSLPLDVLIDTVLLVPDICAGVTGWRKGDRWPDVPEGQPQAPEAAPAPAADRPR